MNFENDQDGPKRLEFLPTFQGISLPSSSQVEPIAEECWWEMTRFISPTKVQVSSGARCVDFNDDQNEPGLFEFSRFSQGIRLQSGSQI